ncbi:glycogen-binding subunit 76A [Drosophila obscura]|uniref:glycogen-binding subunit 76A n=1 Tax=Drosophila obscura TaxID=7282 RepID=UPI000B9FF0B9|nr:glycogen-binding subunit 76A [Drosophila obscura]XP_022229304.1 glycogen-binding subunit 76A [Drosophila obscura]XP_022229306.1 glycogen-binding subunit 76A [Drosophila obscura]
MNDPGDIPLTHSSTPDSRPPCSIISIIPTIGMSSCRGRAEAFARSLSSKLRTLGTQANEEGVENAEDEPIINGTNTNTWVNAHDSEQTVTDLQPLRHESDSFFDFDCELESPGSPVDECEYLRLIETASNTPHNSTAESGYACASAASSHSSSTADGPYFDATSTSASAVGSVIPDQILVTVNAQALHPQATELGQHSATELNDSVNALPMNGGHELTNGQQQEQQEQQLAEEQQQLEQEKQKDTAEQKTQQQKELVVDVLDQEDEALLQAQILSELLQQSDNFKASGGGIVVQAPLEEPSTLTNGHVDAEEQLELKDEVLDGADRTLEERIYDVPTPDRTLDASASPERDATAVVDTSPDSGVDEADKSVAADPATGSILTVDVDLVQLEQAKLDAAEAAKKSSHSHAIDTTDDEDDCRPQRVRRCSSLKTGKTPPGTPGRKKIVRFADVLGLDLADVKTFLDEIPTIPKSAFEDLEILESEPPMQMGPKSDKLLMPLFQQPGGLPTFLDAVREKQVSLENAAVSDNINQTISGSVRVRNLDFHKSVHIRYSLDGWRSYADLQANYVENSCDGFSDKFTFVLFGNSMHVGQRLEFAVRFQCKGQQFWDSNYGANYCFQCLPSSTHATSASPASVATGAVIRHHSHSTSMVGLLSPTAGDAWCSSFY